MQPAPLASLVLASLVLLTGPGCRELAIRSTPKKETQAAQDELSRQAEAAFWTALHQGRYQDIPAVTRLLTAAYLQNPNDPKLAAHLGFIHIWKITERQRVPELDPTVVDHIILARKYFEDAVALAPEDARYLGFLGDAQISEGKIFNDQRMQTRGYFTLKQAIRAWPQFNYFTAGYPMSILPADSRRFAEALEWQWKTLEACAHQPVDQQNPCLGCETRTGPDRACWNSAIAPFNFEGFFLNMGDMLVKQGDWKTALTIYGMAKKDKDYSKWPYAYLLEDRIRNAQANVRNFNQDPTVFSAAKPVRQAIDPAKVVLFNTGFGCMACHQER